MRQSASLVRWKNWQAGAQLGWTTDWDWELNQSRRKVKLPSAPWSFEKETLTLQLLSFFFLLQGWKRKQVLKSSRDVIFCSCGCLINPVNSFEMKLMGCLSTAAHHDFRKTTFGILAYQREVQTFSEKGKPHNRDYFSSSSHINIFRILSHLSYASNKFGLYHHTVIFRLVKCRFLSCLHQVVWCSLHCIASSLQTNHLQSQQSVSTHFYWKN